MVASSREPKGVRFGGVVLGVGDWAASEDGLYLYEDDDVLAGEMAAAFAREGQALVVLATSRRCISRCKSGASPS